MEDWICYNMQSSLVVTVAPGRQNQDMKSEQQVLVPIDSLVTLAMVRYFTPADDQEIVWLLSGFSRNRNRIKNDQSRPSC